MVKSRSVPRVARHDLESTPKPAHEIVSSTQRQSRGLSATEPSDGEGSVNNFEGSWRSWPSGIRPTAIRRRWFEKLQPLPRGLDLAEIAGRLNEPYHAVYRWAQFFRYPFPDRRSCKPSIVNWDTVEWTWRDADIARELGVSRERVRQVRKKGGIAPPVNPVRQFTAFVAANSERLATMTVQEAVLASGEPLGLQAARRILHAAGIKPIRRTHYPTFDWRIPNRDLAEIWGVSSHYVATLRRRLRAGPARWNLRGGAKISSRIYKKVLNQEKQNACRAAETGADGNNQMSKYMQNS